VEPARDGIVESLAARPPRDEADDDAFDEWVGRALEALDPLMTLLGVLFALLVGYELAARPEGAAATWLAVAGWALWAMFAVEFAAMLVLAPSKPRFLKRHWLQLAMLLLPTLRLLRFVRLLRLGRALPASRVISSSYRAVGTARRLLRSRLGYLIGVTAIVAVAIAELALFFEREAEDAAFDSFGSALLWSFGVVVGQQGDPVPESTGAHIVMLLGFTFGIALVASLAGTIGAFFVDARRERAAEETAVQTSVR
jgi:voltage-gated potassium channel